MSRLIIRRKPKRKQRTINMRCTNVYESGPFDNKYKKTCSSDIYYKHEDNVKIRFICKKCGHTKEIYKKMSTNNKYTIDDLEKALNNAKAGVDVEKNQDIIIDSKNFYYVLIFAIEVSNANIEKLQQLILDSDDYQYAYLFATNVNKADIEKLSEVVLKSKSNRYIYWFANEVEGVNVQKFIDVLKTRLPADDKYVVRLEEKLANMKPAKTVQKAYVEAVSGKDFEENQKFIIDSGDLDYVYEFAKVLRFNGANIALLEQAIIDSTRSDKYKFAYYFAKNVDAANIEKLSDVVLNSNNSDLKIDFAKNVPGANIQRFIFNLKSVHNFSDTHGSIVKLKKILEKQKPVKTPEEAYNEAIKGINVKENEKIVLSKKDPRLSYNFARNIPTADIKAHEAIVLENGRCDVSFSFGMTVPGADIQAHIDLMKKWQRYGWELELKNKLKEIETNKLIEEDLKFIEEQDKKFFLSLKDDEETLKILKVVRILEEEESAAIKEIILKENAKFLEDLSQEDLKKESIEKETEEDKKETLQYIDYWIKEIKQNDLYAIEILKQIIENKFYDRIDILKQYHPGVININFLKNLINGNYPDNYKNVFKEAISYLNPKNKPELIKENVPQDMYSSKEEYKTHLFSEEENAKYISATIENISDLSGYPKNKPEPIKETNWLKENAIEGIYQGISQTVVKNLAKSIVELLKLNKIDEPSIYLAEKFLSSPVGISILLALVGAGIHFIPAKLTQDNVHIQKVGDRCIQSCTAIGSEHLINLAINMVLPAITNAISSNKQISVMEILEPKLNARVNVENDSDLDLYEKLAMIAAKK